MVVVEERTTEGDNAGLRLGCAESAEGLKLACWLGRAGARPSAPARAGPLAQSLCLPFYPYQTTLPAQPVMGQQTQRLRNNHAPSKETPPAPIAAMSPAPTAAAAAAVEHENEVVFGRTPSGEGPSLTKSSEQTATPAGSF